MEDARHKLPGQCERCSSHCPIGTVIMSALCSCSMVIGVHPYECLGVDHEKRDEDESRGEKLHFIEFVCFPLLF